MRTSTRRGVFAAVSAVLVAAVVAAGPPASGATADEAFYTPPSPLPSGQNGDVIKSQPSKYNNATATRIMYLSRDAKDKPIPVTGTVIVPTKQWAGPGPRPIVAYTPFTAGMGDQCAPSKTLAGEPGDMAAPFQNGFVDALLGKGFAVAQTDYQGLGTPGEHTYVMRLSEGHTVLDVLRAAQRLPGTGLDKGAPLGIAGYSQGGGASAAAAEMAESYAPELDIKGAYVGAPVADLGMLAKTLDGSMYAGFLGFALIGINEAYPESGMLDLANEEGAKLFLEARKKCTIDATFSYLFKQTKTLTKDGKPVGDYLSQAPFDKIVAENKRGNVGPSFPTLVEHAPTDDVLPYKQGQQMAKDWCGKGSDVQFKDIQVWTPVFSHVMGMLSAPPNASNWLGDRFAGKPTTSNCGQF